jgi:hypothetical protein
MDSTPCGHFNKSMTMPNSFLRGLRGTVFASTAGLLFAGVSPSACSSAEAPPEGLGASGSMCTGANCAGRSGTGGSSVGGSSVGGSSVGGSSAGGSSAGGSSAGGASGGSISVEAGTTDPDSQEACLQQDVEFTNDIPNVLLLVDRSGSMHKPIVEGGTEIRWTALRTALIDPTAGLVPLNQALVNFGLMLYTGPDSTQNPVVGHEDTIGTADEDYIENPPCPYLVPVPIALNNSAAIEAAYRPITMQVGTLGQTPTGESVEAAVPVLTGLDPALFPGRKAIVLATDGEPDLCSNGNDEMGGRTRSVNAVTAAFAEGVTTFVISVGSDTGEAHLRQVANVGQGYPAADMTDRFYRASDAAQLKQAFEDIVSGVRACTIALNGAVKGTGADGNVTINGMPVTFGDPNGWRLNGPGEIEFLGASCDLIKMNEGNVSIGIKFPCASFEPK